jgi:hypothetical protein
MCVCVCVWYRDREIKREGGREKEIERERIIESQYKESSHILAKKVKLKNSPKCLNHCLNTS